MLDRTSERGRLLYLYPKSKQCGYEFSVPALETYVMQRTSPILRLCLYSFNIFFQHQAIGHELFCRSHNRFCIATAVAITLNNRAPWVGGRSADAVGLGQWYVTACKLVHIALALAAIAEVPSCICPERRLHHRRADACDIVAVRVDRRHQDRIAAIPNLRRLFGQETYIRIGPEIISRQTIWPARTIDTWQ